jgi:hypothetical protein
MISDPAEFLQRVLRETLNQSVDAGTVPGVAEDDAETLLAHLLSGRLAGLIEGTSAESVADPIDGSEAAWIAHYDALLHRNRVMARALGACECWGEDPYCPICAGDGLPGWRVPDERHYSRHIRPAVLRLQHERRRHPWADSPPETHPRNRRRP